jgi:hypothetical protein
MITCYFNKFFNCFCTTTWSVENNAKYVVLNGVILLIFNVISKRFFKRIRNRIIIKKLRQHCNAFQVLPIFRSLCYVMLGQKLASFVIYNSFGVSTKLLATNKCWHFLVSHVIHRSFSPVFY